MVKFEKFLGNAVRMNVTIQFGIMNQNVISWEGLLATELECYHIQDFAAEQIQVHTQAGASSYYDQHDYNSFT